MEAQRSLTSGGSHGDINTYIQHKVFCKAQTLLSIDWSLSLTIALILFAVDTGNRMANPGALVTLTVAYAAWFFLVMYYSWYLISPRAIFWTNFLIRTVWSLSLMEVAFSFSLSFQVLLIAGSIWLNLMGYLLERASHRFVASEAFVFSLSLSLVFTLVGLITVNAGEADQVAGLSCGGTLALWACLYVTVYHYLVNSGVGASEVSFSDPIKLLLNWYFNPKPILSAVCPGCWR